MTRRQAFWSVLLAAAPATAQDIASVFMAHGISLPPDRLQRLTPIIARRQVQLAALRAFPMPDHIAPRHG